MTLVTGGSKCGKSRYAESILDSFGGRKIYIATMQPFGDDARSAISFHRILRAGKGFETIEKYTDIDKLELPKNCAVLLECAVNLCANEMFCDKEIIDPTEKILRGFKRLKDNSQELVIVSGNVGSDGISYDKGTADYIRILGAINQQTAALADNVVECVYGIPVPLKGAVI